VRGVDTNVLVRYLTNDDTSQAELAERFLDQCRQDGELVFIPILVLCELIWVLDRTFGRNKPVLIEVVENLLATDIFRLEQESTVRRSLEHFRQGKAGFSDYMIGEINREEGCQDPVSFDRALRAASGFQILA
jgi:predicted nucleic-acid-binding protein